MKTEKEKMLAGELYLAQDEELKKDRQKALKFTKAFNSEDEPEKRAAIVKELFESVGKQLYIEPPFRCDYGCNIGVGNNFYANYDCIILDVNKVKIGSNVMFGPRVCIYTAGHPIDANIRSAGLEFGLPVTIGDNVWIGGNSVILPAVTVGNNVVIGAGSVVTKDIPSGVVAAGNPCRVIRKITKDDK
ncbi:MAG: sugar O-acetyltransferase [Heliobacteriaceae bacterium]|jgi:maltose O-acetyltransferase|nr:sugar O-acetyltransferase [Heliobacteriaceae bacterium]